MVIAIIGGGNIGTLMAGEFAARGHDVRLAVSDPALWDGTISVLRPDGGVAMEGELGLVTADIAKAARGADVVWVTYPTFMLREAADELLPSARRGQRIGVVPGGCAEFFFAEHVRRGAVLVGLQRVHSIARVKERGRSVLMLRRKPEIHVAALPSARAGESAGLAG